MILKKIKLLHLLIIYKKLDKEQQIFEGIDIGDKKIDSMYIDSTKEEVELLSLEERSFDKEDFIKGEKTPVYFGSAMNNFGVIHVLDKLVADAPQPLPRQSIERLVNTDEKNLVLLYLKSKQIWIRNTEIESPFLEYVQEDLQEE